ncbi:D-alanyl-D-alanine carboxypeptidase family protein [Bacillota bacterium]
MRKTISLIIIIIIMLVNSSGFSYGAPELQLIGQSAILIDATTGKILYEKNSHVQHYPASTTKIMTGILALENLKLTDKVDIDAETPFTEGSRIYLLEGEDVTVEDVMFGMMLESANDSAVALAKKISGSVEEFAVLMNKKAQEMGALDTNFVNPNGLHDDTHLSTAYDLAMMAKYAMKNSAFRDFVSTYQYTMAATNLQETRYFYNTNRMLYDNVHKVTVNGQLRGCQYDGITGIKTGYTSKAGGCLVAGAKRGSTELIAVTLASTDMGRFQDCITLLDYGFENFKTINALQQGKELGTVPVSRGSVKNVRVILPHEVNATLPAEASASLIRTEVELYESVEAPVIPGQKAGSIRIFAGDELIGEYDAVAADQVDRGGWMSVAGISDAGAKKIRNLILYLVILLLTILLFYILIKRRQVRIRRRKRLQREERHRLLQEQNKTRWDLEYWSRRY